MGAGAYGPWLIELEEDLLSISSKTDTHELRERPAKPVSVRLAVYQAKQADSTVGKSICSDDAMNQGCSPSGSGISFHLTRPRC